MKAKYLLNKDTPSKALVLPYSLKGEKKVSFLLPKLARLVPKGPVE